MKTIAQIKAFLSNLGANGTLNRSATLSSGYAYHLIEHLYQDHRLVTEKGAFIALKGSVHDGHRYVGEAIAKGVKLVVVEDLNLIGQDALPFVLEIKGLTSILAELANWFYGNPSKDQQIFAVTGTNGKSSICHFLAHTLNQLTHKVGVLGTIGNGIFPKLSDSALTTLDNLSLQRILRFFHDNGVNTVAMEASSHAIVQQRITGVNIKTAIFSNLDIDHLDYHHTMENYFQAKCQLFILPSVHTCVINADDNYGKRLYDYLSKETTKTVLRFSLLDERADCYMPIRRIDLQGFEIDVYFQGKYQRNVMIPVIGEYNISNIGAMLCALFANGYDFNDVISTLAHLQNTKGRLEQLSQPGEALVVIDYAHTADALAKALKSLRTQTQGKLYCVFGCGGARERTKRPLMAKVAQGYADFTIVTEDNSRTDPIDDIVKDILSGFDHNFDRFVVIKDRKKAIEYVLQQAGSKDVILLAGKGHETYLCKNNQKIHFDEREVVSNFWKKWRKND